MTHEVDPDITIAPYPAAHRDQVVRLALLAWEPEATRFQLLPVARYVEALRE